MAGVASAEDFTRVHELLHDQTAILERLESELRKAQQLFLSQLQTSLPSLTRLCTDAKELAQSTTSVVTGIEADITEMRQVTTSVQGLHRVVGYLCAAQEVAMQLQKSREALDAGLGVEALKFAGRAAEALRVFPAESVAAPAAPEAGSLTAAEEPHQSPTSFMRDFNRAFFLGKGAEEPGPAAAMEAEGFPPPNASGEAPGTTSVCSVLARRSRAQCADFLQDAMQKHADDFRQLLSTAQYPRQGATMLDPAAEDRALADLKRGWQQLLTAHRLADGLVATDTAPEELFIEPIRLRFNYHFTGKKETNRMDRPEWLFQFMERILVSNLPFLSHFSHAVDVSSGGLLECGILPKFIEGCVRIVCQKLRRDLATLQAEGNESLFCHHLNESIAFDRLLTAKFGYPANALAGALKQRRQFCLDVVTEEPRLWGYWLDIDKRFAEQRLAAMLGSPDCWLPQYGQLAEIDNVKISRGAQMTSSLLMALNAKYSTITSVDVLDTFIRSIHRTTICNLLQGIKEAASTDLPLLGPTTTTEGPTSSEKKWRVYCSALNSACAMATVLSTWSDLPLFADLQAAFQGARRLPGTADSPDEQGETPGRYFDDLIAQFTTCSDVMTQQLIGKMMGTFRLPVTKGYAGALLDVTRALHDPTGRLTPEEVNGLVCSVSPVIHMAALDLTTHLSFLAAHITSDRFGMLWRGLAAQLDAFLFHHVSSHPALQRLAYAQARQFQVDVQGLALLLFDRFSRNPKGHLATCQQAGALLTLHPVEQEEVLRCLREEATRAEGRAQLQKHGVTGLTDDQLCHLLWVVQ
eukprot:GGOE01062214.1.p1 GENE.GGOE01062214.1~~GGOE01062214.1.p1  ORF type:complete len:808 (+),score=233.85 GGOE01062214.1:60-2483(+)